jgi:hypothetical protein
MKPGCSVSNPAAGEFARWRLDRQGGRWQRESRSAQARFRRERKRPGHAGGGQLLRRRHELVRLPRRSRAIACVPALFRVQGRTGAARPVCALPASGWRRRRYMRTHLCASDSDQARDQSVNVTFTMHGRANRTEDERTPRSAKDNASCSFRRRARAGELTSPPYSSCSVAVRPSPTTIPEAMTSGRPEPSRGLT